MIKEIELYVCDEDDIVLLSDGRDTHVCMECEKPMTLAKFERKLTQDTPDEAKCLLCLGIKKTHSETCPNNPANIASRVI